MITKDLIIGNTANGHFPGSMDLNKVNADWAKQVLTYWFKELNKKDWYVSSPKLDSAITSKFKSTHSQIKVWPSLPLDADAHRALAAIIVLDQFSRNMFRGTKQAFAFDSLALQIAEQARARELDLSLNDDEKQFMYMPFMHSENLNDQKTALTLFAKLGHQKHAKEHFAIIKKFNRFPHRNEVLNRKSTDQELEFLKDAKRFGQ